MSYSLGRMRKKYFPNYSPGPGSSLFSTSTPPPPTQRKEGGPEGEAFNPALTIRRMRGGGDRGLGELGESERKGAIDRLGGSHTARPAQA
eukprot:scaffold6589_cov116-Isochrysis_galbana.AAC.2